MQQYIHLLSNTTTISPTDIWKLSDPNIKPQSGYQVSVGYYQNFKSNTIETSVEAYYKRTKNYLDYRSGANLILNPHIETDVIATKGEAYGIEFLIKKNAGKLNGWLSYTYSRSLLKSDDILQGEIVLEWISYLKREDLQPFFAICVMNDVKGIARDCLQKDQERIITFDLSDSQF